MSKKRAPQLGLGLKQKFGWGGARVGAGRKKSGRAGVAHRARPALSGHEPLHLTLRVVPGVSSLRGAKAYALIRAAIGAGCARFGFRVLHFVVLSNHLHFLVEADNAGALSKGAGALQVRIAKALNKLFERSGRLFVGRYHARVLRTPLEVRNTLRYIFFNFAKHLREHGRPLPSDRIDPCSSASLFDGWTIRVRRCTETIVAEAKTWLAREGWSRHGKISPAELPATR